MDIQYNKENKEELQSLLRKFYDEAEAEQAAETIEAGERILNSYPAPEPAEATKWRIKAAVAKALQEKRQSAFSPRCRSVAAGGGLRRSVYRVLATAAVIIIMLAVGVKIIEDGGVQKTESPMVVIDTGAGGVMDAKAAVLSEEVDQVERQLATIKSGQINDEQADDADELETEYLTIASDFWKG
jgi:cytochrome c biogenesis protein ResB